MIITPSVGVCGWSGGVGVVVVIPASDNRALMYYYTMSPLVSAPVEPVPPVCSAFVE